MENLLCRKFSNNFPSEMIHNFCDGLLPPSKSPQLPPLPFTQPFQAPIFPSPVPAFIDPTK